MKYLSVIITILTLALNIMAQSPKKTLSNDDFPSSSSTKTTNSNSTSSSNLDIEDPNEQTYSKVGTFKMDEKTLDFFVVKSGSSRSFYFHAKDNSHSTACKLTKDSFERLKETLNEITTGKQIVYTDVYFGASFDTEVLLSTGIGKNSITFNVIYKGSKVSFPLDKQAILDLLNLMNQHK